jgi:CHASE3 domain sensor protein
MMDDRLQSFRRHLRWAFVIPLLLTALIGGVFIAQTYYLRRTFQEVEKSYSIQSRARSILKLILDMETGLRGYLLTGEGRFLEHYRTAQPQVKPALDDLLVSVRNDPEEYKDIVHIRTYYTSWDEYSERMIAWRQKSDEVSDFRLNLEGKLYIDLIRRDIDEILRSEELKATSVLAMNGPGRLVVRIREVSKHGASS